MKYYHKRKDYHVDRLAREKNLLDAKVRFILMVISGELIVSKRKRNDLIADLKAKGFKPYNEIFGKSKSADDDEDEAAPASASQAGQGGKESKEKQEPKSGFDYLLGMPIWSLTYERVEELRKQMKDKTQELDELKRKTPEVLWEIDLKAVEHELEVMEEERALMQQEGGKKKRSRPKAKAKAKGRKDEDAADDADDPMEEEEEEDIPPPKKAKGEENTADLLARLKDRQKSRSHMTLSSA